MADRFPARIKIGGKIKASDLPSLFQALEDDGAGYGWGEHTLGIEPNDLDAIRKYVKSTDPGNGLVFMNDEARYGMFNETEDICKALGLVYERQSDSKYEWDGETVFCDTEGKEIEMTSGQSGQLFIDAQKAREAKESLEKGGDKNVAKALKILQKLLPAIPEISPFEIIEEE